MRWCKCTDAVRRPLFHVVGESCPHCKDVVTRNEVEEYRLLVAAMGERESMISSETIFRVRVREWIDKHLKNVVVLSIQQLSICGDPDLVLCLNGYFVAMELKGPGGKPSELQTFKIRKIQDKGLGWAAVVSPENWTEVREQLLEIDKGASAYGKKSGW